jgi:hypothetical protein
MGSNRNIYKVDQLQAMRWVQMAWKEISEETIQNCWNHTKIISPRDQDGKILEMPERNEPIQNDEESQLEEQLTSYLATLRVRDPMKISDLVNLDAENNTHINLTDTELIEAAVTVEDEAIVIAEDEIEPELPLGRQTEALIDAIRIVTERGDPNTSTSVVRSLRVILSEVREERRIERESRVVQTTLNDFFRPNF